MPVVKIWCIFRTVPGQPWLCHLVALSVDLTGVLIWLPCLGSYLTGGLARLPCLGSYLVTLPRDLLGDLTLDFNWRPNLGLGNLTFLGDLTLGLIWWPYLGVLFGDLTWGSHLGTLPGVLLGNLTWWPYQSTLPGGLTWQPNVLALPVNLTWGLTWLTCLGSYLATLPWVLLSDFTWQTPPPPLSGCPVSASLMSGFSVAATVQCPCPCSGCQGTSGCFQ